MTKPKDFSDEEPLPEDAFDEIALGEAERQAAEQEMDNILKDQDILDDLTLGSDFDVSKKQKELQKREKTEETFKKQEQEIMDHELKEEDVEKVKKQAEMLEKLTVRDAWLKAFNHSSFYNELAGEILMHCVIGMLLRDKTIYRSDGKKMDYRMGFFWIQNPGSGKDEAVKFVSKICELMKIKKEGDDNSIRFVTLSGSETDAAMLDSFLIEYDPRARREVVTDEIIPGIFSDADILYYDEASVLLNPQSQHSKMTSEFLLRIIENKPIHKKLQKWQGRETVTESDATLIATTRPVPAMKPYLLYNGLLQRCLVLVRQIDSETRDKMDEKVSLYSFGQREDEDKFLQEIKYIVSELNKMQRFAENNDIVVKKDAIKEMTKYVLQNIRNMSEDLITNIGSTEHKMILESFKARYNSHLLRLSYHNAIIRRSQYVELIDVEQAFRLLNRCFEELKVWVEETIQEDKEVTMKQHKRQQIIKKAFDGNTSMTNAELVDVLTTKLKVCTTTAYSIIRKFTEGKKSLLIKSDKELMLRN